MKAGVGESEWRKGLIVSSSKVLLFYQKNKSQITGVENIEETMLGECGLYFCVGYDLCFSRVYAG